MIQKKSVEKTNAATAAMAMTSKATRDWLDLSVMEAVLFEGPPLKKTVKVKSTGPSISFTQKAVEGESQSVPLQFDCITTDDALVSHNTKTLLPFLAVLV